MASLYQTSQNARRILIGVLGIVILILLYDTFTRAQQNNLNTNTEKRFYMNPDLKFGEIPTVTIPSLSLAQGSNPIYARLSVFPSSPDVAYVYKIEQPKEKLLTFENALSTAQVLGFTVDMLKEEGKDMSWTVDGTKTLRFNRDSQEWNLTTSYLDNLEARRRKTISSQTQTYASNATSLLNSLDFSSVFGFRDGQAVVRLALIGVDGSFIETQRPEEAQYVSVNLYRKLPLADLKPDSEQPELDKGEIKPVPRTGLVYSHDPRQGIFRIVASNNLTDYPKDVFELNYTDFNYTGETGKYYIISADEGWSKVQRGEGSLVSIEPQNVDYFSQYPTVNVRRFEMDARKTTLAYYEPKEWNGYATPIYIFEGTATLDDGNLANFKFFVDAVQRVE